MTRRSFRDERWLRREPPSLSVPAQVADLPAAGERISCGDDEPTDADTPAD